MFRTVHAQLNDVVREAIDATIREHGEIGVQVAAYLGGELVVDAWGGLADVAAGRPVDGETLFNVFSVSKAVVSTTVHLQAEKGLLDYDAPIAEYWPEWGCRGKERATVRDALCHRTGVPQMPPGITPAALGDWQLMVERIAELPPLFSVGEESAYQALTYGWILGEVVRRTDPAMRSYDQYVRDELTGPLGIDDLWFGVDGDAERRLATLYDSGSAFPAPPESPLARAVPPAVALIPSVYERSEVRRGCIPGTGGIANARSIARFWALWANGGTLDGVRLLSRQRVDDACLHLQRREPDRVMFDAVMPLTRGGFWHHDEALPDVGPARGARTICVPGAGGSLGWADPDTGLAVAFCHNHMRLVSSGDAHPASRIAAAIRQRLGVDA